MQIEPLLNVCRASAVSSLKGGVYYIHFWEITVYQRGTCCLCIQKLCVHEKGKQVWVSPLKLARRVTLTLLLGLKCVAKGEKEVSGGWTVCCSAENKRVMSSDGSISVSMFAVGGATTKDNVRQRFVYSYKNIQHFSAFYI